MPVLRVVAQLAEHRSPKPGVAGSSPAGPVHESPAHSRAFVISEPTRHADKSGQGRPPADRFGPRFWAKNHSLPRTTKRPRRIPASLVGAAPSRDGTVAQPGGGYGSVFGDRRLVADLPVAAVDDHLAAAGAESEVVQRTRRLRPGWRPSWRPGRRAGARRTCRARACARAACRRAVRPATRQMRRSAPRQASSWARGAPLRGAPLHPSDALDGYRDAAQRLHRLRDHAGHGGGL